MPSPGLTNYKGVTGDMVFDPNCKNIAPLFPRPRPRRPDRVSSHHDGEALRPGRRELASSSRAADSGRERQTTSDHRHLRSTRGSDVHIARRNCNALLELKRRGKSVSLIAIPSEASWGKASNDLVKAVYQDRVVA